MSLTPAPHVPVRAAMRPIVMFLLQAAMWVLLVLAFAALIDLSDLAPWSEALLFSCTNWLPWIVLAPGVFWLARRFPFERGYLLKGIPIHLIACALCCFAMLAVSAYFAPWSRGRPPFRSGDGRSGGWERREPSPRPTPEAQTTAPASGAPTAPTTRSSSPEAAPPSSVEQRGTHNHEGRKTSSGSGRGFRSSGSFSIGDRFLARFWPPFSGVVLRANVSAAVYLIIAAFAHAFTYHRRAREREQEALALAAGLSRAKLDALRLQLQPHFLFNTLNAISTLVHRDPVAADELIGDLSELLRLSLQTSEHEVPLARELELLDCYLAIESARLGARLKIFREIDPAALSALVPTFVLQPVAENAIRHGIEPRLAPGTLTLRADVVGTNLRLVVTDDGVGLKPATANGRRGIGITNTQERLRALHGEAAQLDITAPASGGVQVEILLPLRSASASTHRQ